MDAYVSGILIDDDLTPAITTFYGMGWNSLRLALRPQRDAEVVTIYKNWDVKSAFTTNPLANPNLQGDAAANPVETKPSLSSIDSMIKQVSMQFNLTSIEIRRSLD